MSKATARRDSLQRQIDELQGKLDKVVHKLLRACHHKDVVEVPSNHSMLGVKPPHRVCAGCGRQESGWYNQYIDVLAPSREIEFYEAMRIRNKLTRHSTESTHVNDD